MIFRVSSFALLLASVGSADTPSYAPPASSQTVATVSFEWRDAKRDREVPVKIYYPKDASGALPVILFSHGLGGSREGYEYLGRHWAGCGFVSVHLQHAGSDSEVWTNLPQGERGAALQKAGLAVGSAVNRPRDVSFVIDELERQNGSDAFVLHGRLDLKHIGVSGHSFGGYTTLAVAGQTFMTPLGKSQAGDPRINAGIQMSAPVNRRRDNLDESYGSITIPLMHMTGTKDFVPLFPDTTAEDRRLPYAHMGNAETCFVNFKDGDHMIFSGSPRLDKGERVKDEAFHQLICAGTTAFWDAYLRDSGAAKAWLLDGGYDRLLGDSAAFEHKRPGQASK